jgi:hypothetical protein
MAGGISFGGNGGVGVPSGGVSGAGGGCVNDGSQGGHIGADGCEIPWWGTTLDGVKGLLECPPPDNPALLAFGQTNLPVCWQLTGPVDEVNDPEGGLSCCYLFDESTCCSGRDEPGYDCIDIPYFGTGNLTAMLPTRPIEDPLPACGRSFGDPVALSRAEAAERMIGLWVICGDTPDASFGDGIIFDGDGTFHFLELADDLRLSEREGCMQGGLWGFVGGLLRLHIETNTRFVSPTFTSGPEERLILDSVQFVRAIYSSDL